MLEKIKEFLLTNKYLALIVILAVTLRFLAIGTMPPALNWDEVSHGYNAYSILNTGKDEWGKTLPLIFRAYGDYKLPVYIYATVFPVALLGLNAFAVRLPSALAGIGTVIFTYLLVIELFKKMDKKLKVKSARFVAVIAALLVAIEPWSLFLSRPAFEANLALFLFVSGLYFFLKALSQPAYYMLLSTILFGLTVWTYNSYRIFTPLMMVALALIYGKKIKDVFRGNKKLTTYYILLTALLFLPMFWQLTNASGRARYEWVSIIDQGAIARINEQRNTSEFSPLVSRLFFNKGTYFIQRFAKNYLSHFYPRFLFTQGGDNYQFSVPGYGLIYPINSALLILGIYYLLTRKDKNALLVLSWLLLSPIPSSLTREAPHVLRSITMLPVPMIITSFGLNFITLKMKANYKRVALMSYTILGVFFLWNYLSIYFDDYKKKYSWAWQYGYEQVVDYVKKIYAEYDKIIITKKYGEPHEFFLFYWPWDPESYRKDPNLKRFYQSNWYWVDAFNKFYFVNDWQIDEEGTSDYEFRLESRKSVRCTMESERCLLVTSPENVPQGWNKLNIINFLDGEPAFEIYTN